MTIRVVALAALACVLIGQSAAARSDRDGDGLSDRFEQRWGITDPDKRDSDSDGIWDGMEDEDGDRLSNRGEQIFKTDPADRDSDGDGTKDGGEDSDGNGINDAIEQDRRPVPANLKPPLDDAFWDVPASYSNGCHTGPESAILRPCVYGVESGSIAIALFGDSHALQWLPALEKAAARADWRVTTLTKTACPSVDVAFSSAAFEGTEKPCRRWRQAALAWLQVNPQDIVIITNASRYPIVDEQGERVYEASKEPIWQAGLARIIEAMPADTRAVVLADTPNLAINPVSCLGSRERVSDCVTRRARALVPEHDAAERATADATGATFVDLNSVVCSYDPCPVLNGSTLMWRNESHLTATYAKQLAPAMRSLVGEVLDQGGQGEHVEAQVVATADPDGEP